MCGLGSYDKQVKMLVMVKWCYILISSFWNCSWISPCTNIECHLSGNSVLKMTGLGLPDYLQYCWFLIWRIWCSGSMLRLLKPITGRGYADSWLECSFRGAVPQHLENLDTRKSRLKAIQYFGMVIPQGRQLGSLYFSQQGEMISHRHRYNCTSVASGPPLCLPSLYSYSLPPAEGPSGVGEQGCADVWRGGCSKIRT